MVYVFCDAFEPDLLGGRCNRRGTAWHNGDTVSVVFNFPGRKRTTGIFGDCIYRTPSQMEKEHIAQYRRWNCILYAAGAVCILQVTQ